MVSIKTDEQQITFDNRNFVLSEKDFGYVEATHTDFKGVNQIGVYHTYSTLDTREISLTGYIFHDVEANKRQLLSLVNPLKPFDLIVDERKITCYASTTPQFTYVYSEYNKDIVKFMIQAYCPQPCFTTVNRTIANLALWQGDFSFPLIIPEGEGIMMGYKTPSAIADIYNGGDIQTGVIIEFIAEGTLKNPSILDVNTREFIKINKTMQPNEIVTVNTNYGQKSVTSNIDGNILNLLDVDSTFIQLRQGTNTIKYDAEENLTNLSVKMYYYQKYLGV